MASRLTPNLHAFPTLLIRYGVCHPCRKSSDSTLSVAITFSWYSLYKCTSSTLVGLNSLWLNRGVGLVVLVL